MKPRINKNYSRECSFLLFSTGNKKYSWILVILRNLDYICFSYFRFPCKGVGILYYHQNISYFLILLTISSHFNLIQPYFIIFMNSFSFELKKLKNTLEMINIYQTPFFRIMFLVLLLSGKPIRRI